MMKGKEKMVEEMGEDKIDEEGEDEKEETKEEEEGGRGWEAKRLNDKLEHIAGGPEVGLVNQMTSPHCIGISLEKHTQMP